MRLSLVRVAALAAAVVVVLSCDGGPTVTKYGGGLAGGPTGNAPIVPQAPGTPDTSAPLLRIYVPPCAVGMTFGTCPKFPPTPAAARLVPARLVNVGDQILVETRVMDPNGGANGSLGGSGSLQITGYKITGDPNLGTDQRIARYPTITWPSASVTHRGHKDTPGEALLQDTVIRRFLTPGLPLDQGVGDLWVVAVLTDSAGNSYSDSLLVEIVDGPKVTLNLPDATILDVPVDKSLTLQATMQSTFGLDSLKISIAGPWAARAGDTLFFSAFKATPDFPPGSTAQTMNGVLTFPATAAVGNKININAMAWDANGNPGASATKIVSLRASNASAPLVQQAAPAKMEIDDSVEVTVHSDTLITKIGQFQVNARTGATLRNDELTFTTPQRAPLIVKLPLDCRQWTAALGGTVSHPTPCTFGLSNQGDTIKVYSYAVDQNSPAKTGYSVAPGANVPVTAQAAAYRNDVIIAYGRTFPLPVGRQGIVGDIAVDPVTGNVFLSNTSFNLLEVWNGGAFTGNVAVGSEPWGLFVDQAANQLLVANSGSTTISTVNLATLAENPAARIRTRDNVIYQVGFTFNTTSGSSTIGYDGNHTSYSDRPQYLAKSAGGRIYYSTRPTPKQLPGTIRWLDPTQAFTDSRQIYSYGRNDASLLNTWSIFNADSITVKPNNPGSGINDTLIIFDHKKGLNGPFGPIGASGYPENCLPTGAFAAFCVKDDNPTGATQLAVLAGGDPETVNVLRLTSLELTDTTFAASSENGQWIAFGEGNTTGITGRLMAINDPVGGLAPCVNGAPLSCPRPGFFSPAITVDDIADNASERITGLALDATGATLLVHGAKTYAATVQLPFHMRLDGFFDSFDNGAGVAYPPSVSALSVGFTATAGGRIEAFDINHYDKRAEFITKGTLYGALRASIPFAPPPGETVILKLYGLSSEGLVVIDLVDTQRLVTP